MRLSPTEEQFFRIIERVRCISRHEAYIVLQRFMGLKPGQCYKILRNLMRNDLITITNDDKYIIAGNQNGTDEDTRLSRASIFSFYIFLIQILNDKESMETLSYVYKQKGTEILSFVSAGQLYKIHVLSSNDLYKMKIVEEEYLHKSRKLNNDSLNKDMGFREITIFAFMEPGKHQEIIRKTKELKLQLPYRIVVAKTNDLTEKIPFVQYKHHDAKNDENIVQTVKNDL